MHELLLNHEFSIKRANEIHAKQIVSLLYKTWLESYPNMLHEITTDDLKRKFGNKTEKVQQISRFIKNNYSNPNVTYLIAEGGGEVSGFIYATRENDNLNINALYVNREHQKQGIGSSLVAECIKQNTNFNNVTVDVVAYNENAITFYSTLGFNVVGDSHTSFGAFPDGKIIPEIKMRKAISINS